MYLHKQYISIVKLFVFLRTSPGKRVREWRYKYRHSLLRLLMDVSGQVHASAALITFPTLFKYGQIPEPFLDNVGRGKFLFLQREEPRSPVPIPMAITVSRGTVFWYVKFHRSVKGTDISVSRGTVLLYVKFHRSVKGTDILVSRVTVFWYVKFDRSVKGTDISVSRGTVFWYVKFHRSIKGTDISDGS